MKLGFNLQSQVTWPSAMVMLEQVEACKAKVDSIPGENHPLPCWRECGYLPCSTRPEIDQVQV